MTLIFFLNSISKIIGCMIKMTAAMGLGNGIWIKLRVTSKNEEHIYTLYPICRTVSGLYTGHRLTTTE